MATTDASTPDLSLLIDYARGKLTVEDSLKITEELEQNPTASKNLEFILKLIAFFEEQLADDPD